MLYPPLLLAARKIERLVNGPASIAAGEGIFLCAKARGIYAAHNSLVSDAPHHIAVAVHPYYDLSHTQYIARMEEYVASHPGRLLVFEGHESLGATAQRFSQLRDKGLDDVLFVPTPNGIGMPRWARWKDLCVYAGGTGTRVEAIGGYRWQPPVLPGCLDRVVMDLGLRGIDVRVMDREGLTFSAIGNPVSRKRRDAGRSRKRPRAQA